jgi:hypothetical protein
MSVVVGQFGWGEAADEPSPLRFAAPRPAREDTRPTKIANCTTHTHAQLDPDHKIGLFIQTFL